MYEFDRDTAVKPLAPNLWQGEVSPKWFFRTAPNGGYMMALAARALGRALKHADPVSVTANFIAPAKAGPVEIEVTLLRQGNRFSQGMAVLKQNDKVCLQITGNYTDFDRLSDVSCIEATMPEMPAPEETVPLAQADDITFRDRVETRLVPEDYAFFPRGGKKQIEFRGWTRFTDGRPADLLSLLTFADAYPRALIMRTGTIGWIPTMDLTVQCLARPAPGYIATRFYSLALAGGVLEERGELWDSENKLVAVCRQSAAPRVPAERLSLLE